jgi:DNA-binding NarL/FixJ family response regulator
MSHRHSNQATKVHVLVVDDQPLVREAVASVFGREPQFTVSQAGSLTEARQVLDGVDVAILDLSLTDGTGTDLIQELHARNADAKAIVFSSSIDPTVANHALERGAAAAVDKLDGFDQLLAIVKRLGPAKSS